MASLYVPFLEEVKESPPSNIPTGLFGYGLVGLFVKPATGAGEPKTDAGALTGGDLVGNAPDPRIESRLTYLFVRRRRGFCYELLVRLISREIRSDENDGKEGRVEGDHVFIVILK